MAAHIRPVEAVHDDVAQAVRRGAMPQVHLLPGAAGASHSLVHSREDGVHNAVDAQHLRSAIEQQALDLPHAGMGVVQLASIVAEDLAHQSLADEQPHRVVLGRGRCHRPNGQHRLWANVVLLLLRSRAPQRQDATGSPAVRKARGACGGRWRRRRRGATLPCCHPSRQAGGIGRMPPRLPLRNCLGWGRPSGPRRGRPSH
mmetsp:Transcript_92314/g.266471  ORF Transcript_92314/g.266471 Transcript_92314/m.266471 type:complete len:201 (+) Transcript_92314:408-1010(+)